MPAELNLLETCHGQGRRIGGVYRIQSHLRVDVDHTFRATRRPDRTSNINLIRLLKIPFEQAFDGHVGHHLLGLVSHLPFHVVIKGIT